MQLMDQALVEAVQAREIDPDEAYLHAQDKKLLQRFVTNPKLLPQVNLVGSKVPAVKLGSVRSAYSMQRPLAQSVAAMATVQGAPTAPPGGAVSTHRPGKPGSQKRPSPQAASVLHPGKHAPIVPASLIGTQY